MPTPLFSDSSSTPSYTAAAASSAANQSFSAEHSSGHVDDILCVARSKGVIATGGYDGLIILVRIKWPHYTLLHLRTLFYTSNVILFFL